MDSKKFLKESAQRAVQKGDVRKALKLYEELIESVPDDMQARNTLGDIYSRIGMVSEAVNCFVYIAKEMSARGFYHKSIAMLKKAVRLEKNNPEIYRVMADAYSALKLVGEARNSYNWLLDYYSKQKDKKNEIETLRKLYDLTPNDPTVKKILMQALSDSNEDEIVFEQYYKVGMDAFESENYGEAYSSFIKCLKSESGSNDALFMAAECLLKEGKIAEASAFADEHKISEMEDIRARKLLSRVFYACDKTAQALNMVKKVLEEEEDNIEYVKLLGRVYAKLGKNGEAENIYKKILSKLYEKKEYEEFLNMCAELDDEELLDHATREKRAKIFEIKGDKKAAAEDNIYLSISFESDGKLMESLIYAERALKLCPDDENIKKQVDGLNKSIKESEDKLPAEDEDIAEFIMEDDAPVVAETAVNSHTSNVAEKTEVLSGDESVEKSSGENDTLFNLSQELQQDIEGKKKPGSKMINNGKPIDVEDTLVDFKRAVDCTIEENDSQTHFDLGIAYMEMELFAEAIDEFKKSIGNSRFYMDSIIFTARCLFYMGNSEESLDILENALEKCSENSEECLLIKYNRALLYEMMDNPKKALSDYNDILDENPFFKDVKSRIRNMDKQSA